MISDRQLLILLDSVKSGGKRMRCALVELEGYRTIEVEPGDTLEEVRAKLESAEIRSIKSLESKPYMPIDWRWWTCP